MFDINILRSKFSLTDEIFKNISSVNNNIITKFSIIEGCCEYFCPHNGFHCTKEQKRQQAVINLLALVSVARSIADDVVEILRLLFYEEFGSKFNPWRLTYYRLMEKCLYGTPLTDLIERYGLNEDKTSNTFYKKIKDLRDTFAHRGLEYTYNAGSAAFSIMPPYALNKEEMPAHEYAKEVSGLMESIIKEINGCLTKNGKQSLIIKI